jgi:hypothetical protein
MMQTAVETRRARRAPQRGRKLGGNWLKALHAEWRKLSPGLASDLPERDLRMQWTNQKFEQHRSPVVLRAQPVITSWSELTEGQARYLLQVMKEESGSAPDYRGMLIARLAQDLFGAEWDRLLSERLYMRFEKRRAAELTPAEAHAEIEELLSRIARRDGLEIEAVRAKFGRRQTVDGRQGAVKEA